MYTISRESTQNLLLEYSPHFDNVFAPQSQWVIGFVATSGDSGQETQLFCVSVETVGEVNPGDASWTCEYRERQRAGPPGWWELS